MTFFFLFVILIRFIRFVFADNSGCIVIAPVHAKVAVGRHSTVIFIRCSCAYGQSKCISVVIRIKGNSHAFCHIFSRNLIVAGIHTGSIIHIVIGNAQTNRVLASGKVAGQAYNMTGVIRCAADSVSGNTGATRIAVPVTGNENDIVLVNIIKSQRTRAAKTLRTDTDAGRHGYNVRMDICRCLNTIRFQIFIIGYVRTELIGYIRHGNSCTQPHRLAAINFYRHIDDGTAGLCPQLLFCIAAQIAAACCVHFTVFQIFNIRVVCTAAGNIPVSHAHCARCFNIVRTAEISMVCIFQFGIGQSPCTGKTVCRGSETQTHGSVYLGQSIVGRHGDGIDAGVRAALNAALDVVINFADRRGDTGRNRLSSVSRIGKSKIHPAGHLDIPVIGPVVDSRTAAAGVGRCIVNQQGMHLAVHLVHRKAKCPGCVGTGTLTVIRHGNAQPGGHLRAHLYRRILNPFRLGNHGVADHGIYVLPGFSDRPAITGAAVGFLDRIH